jgi:hypothetical protein
MTSPEQKLGTLDQTALVLKEPFTRRSLGGGVWSCGALVVEPGACCGRRGRRTPRGRLGDGGCWRFCRRSRRALGRWGGCGRVLI